jgi:purine-nucleoside phosphorylase
MSKIPEKSIIKPEPIRNFTTEEVVCIPFDPPSRFLKKTIGKLSSKEKNIGFGYLYHLKNKIALYQSLGASSVVLSLERLIVSGAKRIILLGFCGSLNPEFKIMNVVSISKAFSEEGTSKHYFPRKRIFYPSPTLKNRVETVLHDSKLPFLTGSLVSTDAPYRETRSWLKQKQKRRIDLVDMEASAVFAIARFYGIHAAALAIISDELWSGTWNKEFLSSELEEKMKKYFVPFIKGLA